MKLPTKSDLKNNILLPALILVYSASMLWVDAEFTFPVVLVCFVIVALRYRKIRVDYSDALIFFGMFTYQYVQDGLRSGLFYGAAMFAVYQLGKCAITKTGGRDEYGSFPVVIPAVVLFVIGLLNYTYVFRNPPEHRIYEWPDWRGHSVLRTIHEYFLVLIAALLVWFIIYTILKSKWGLIGIALSCTGIAISLFATGRMSTVVCICTMMLVGIGMFIEKGLFKKKWFLIIAAVFAAIIVAAYVCFLINVLGIRDLYEDSFLGRNGGILHNVRFELMYDGIIDIIAHPWGNNTEKLAYAAHDYSFAHNTWIDMGRRGGLLPLILTVGFTFSNVINMIFCWVKSKNINKYALIAGFIGMTLLNMVEPVFLSSPWIWSLEVYLAGLICGVCDSISEPEREIAVKCRV